MLSEIVGRGTSSVASMKELMDANALGKNQAIKGGSYINRKGSQIDFEGADATWSGKGGVKEQLKNGT